MSDITKKKQTSSAVVAKAGIWYTICNFLFRGMAFITTPIFTRLLTKAEVGAFSNYTSWIAILTVLTSFDFAQSIIRSKLEHEDDMDCYVWSILSFTSLSTLLVYGIVCLFPAFFVKLFQIDMKYIHVMFLYLLVSPAYQMLITKHRAFYKYKMFVALTGIMLVSSTLLSLVMVLLMQDKLAGRILGYYLPFIAISCVMYVVLAQKGKRINTAYWKYACVICLPLVPHVLSLILLSSADKILLTQFHGEEVTAIYSIAYSCYHITTILFDSVNKAWAPWLLESLHNQRYQDIRKVSKIYVAVFVSVIVIVLMLVPELILILGGRQYMGAVYCLPPLITSCVFQLVYTMYVNVEFYKKQTWGVAPATIFATLINICLDLYLVPRYPEQCHVITAYTTLAGFVVLFVLHYFLVKRMNMAYIFDIKYMLIILLFTMTISGIMNLLYAHTLIRYTITFLYGLLCCYVVFVNREKILKLLKKKK